MEYHESRDQVYGDVSDYAAERAAWDRDIDQVHDDQYLYDEEAGLYDDDGHLASAESEDEFEREFSDFLLSSSGQRALEEEKARIERKATRLAKKKLKNEAKQSWGVREKEKSSDDESSRNRQSGNYRDSRLNNRRQKEDKRKSHWEVDDAESGMSYLSGKDTGSVASTTTSDDEDLSSDDSDVDAIMAPTLPSQLTSTTAAIETIRPIQLFLYKFVEVSVEVTMEVVGTVWEYSQPIFRNIAISTTNAALDAVYKSLEVIQQRGGESYNVINNAIIDFVEADVEQQGEKVQSSTVVDPDDSQDIAISNKFEEETRLPGELKNFATAENVSSSSIEQIGNS